MTTQIVTRFPPSPTGYLHIGGARTALFNWLFARANGGKMLLRIEDTDRSRYNEDAVDKIREGLIWLGLDWDGDVVSQFSRVDRHREVADDLLAAGRAYRCYASPEELTEMREKARAEGRTANYDGRWRDRDPGDAPTGIKPVIRLKTPLNGETIIDDQVQGKVTWQNQDMDDFIIVRSDGTPTYMLAVVVDDHDMGVTHIIRGDDHLTNAARQTQIFHGLNWDVPVMAHIPLIHGSDGAKLSKRHGALGVEAYKDMGFLPEAMRNYLVRLGWSHGDDEIISDEQMIQWFSLDGIGKSAARFDNAKLENLNGHYIRQSDDTRLVAALAEALPGIDPSRVGPDAVLNDREKSQLLAAMPGLKERAKTLVDIWQGAAFLFASRPFELDDKARGILEKSGNLLEQIYNELNALDEWSVDNVETVIREFTEKNEIGLGKIAQPLRVALTGTTVSPGIFDVLAVLGKEECLARILDQTG
jgi:glutamyl-tRNA synthetase